MQPKLIFRCMCGQQLKASHTSAGKTFLCPSCQSDVVVPIATIDESNCATMRKTPRNQRISATLEHLSKLFCFLKNWLLNRRRDIAHATWWVILVTLICLGLSNWQEQLPSNWAIGNLSIFLLPFVVFWITPLSKFWFFYLFFSTVCGGILATQYHSHAVYSTSWTTTDKIHIYEDVKRNGDRVRKSARGEGWSARGPLSPSGKLHGKWEFIDYSPFESTDKWYWYGEEITEGEWMLRQK